MDKTTTEKMTEMYQLYIEENTRFIEKGVKA